MPDIFTRYELTDDGEVINPPVITQFERQLTDASSAGDQAQIDAIMDEYHDARQDIAKRHNERVDNREREDERLLAEADKTRRAEQEAQQDAAAAQARRAEADRLRQQQGSAFVGARTIGAASTTPPDEPGPTPPNQFPTADDPDANTNAAADADASSTGGEQR